MSVVIFAMVIGVGVLAGWGGRILMEDGGYGLRWDMILGLAGSAVATVLFWALGISPEAGVTMLAGVALAGACIPIVAQRKIWPTLS
jgi:uncharacterized membrane protein YeaQ/YmgE (transglycosylase-associated protein family)